MKHHHHHHFHPAVAPLLPYAPAPLSSSLPYPMLPTELSRNRLDTDLINSSVLRAIAEAQEHTSGIKTKKHRKLADLLEKREHRSFINEAIEE